MSCRHIYLVVVSFFTLIAFFNDADAQSKDRDNPTQLTSNEITGLIDSESRGSFYYYSFIVNPGEVSITLSLQPDPSSNTFDLGTQQVIFILYDRNAEAILSKFVTTTRSSGTGQAVGRVNITRRQSVVLSVNIPNYTSGTGKYRLRINGAVELGQSKSTPRSEGFNDALLSASETSRQKTNTENSNCLPKQGTLIVKMKDGSKKIIDLSEAETVTIVP